MKIFQHPPIKDTTTNINPETAECLDFSCKARQRDLIGSTSKHIVRIYTLDSNYNYYYQGKLFDLWWKITIIIIERYYLTRRMFSLKATIKVTNKGDWMRRSVLGVKRGYIGVPA